MAFAGFSILYYNYACCNKRIGILFMKGRDRKQSFNVYVPSDYVFFYRPAADNLIGHRICNSLHQRKNNPFIACIQQFCIPGSFAADTRHCGYIAALDFFKQYGFDAVQLLYHCT
ncbi:hypothetical protein SDC9_200806 [bioreactor metagenome]|uniref:Uncharacterized protein n=1 Tax=bioreactor metagenome TaxID=1076179 RepID=A0A645IQH2_9ZZZZ